MNILLIVQEGYNIDRINGCLREAYGDSNPMTVVGHFGRIPRRRGGYGLTLVVEYLLSDAYRQNFQRWINEVVRPSMSDDGQLINLI